MENERPRLPQPARGERSVFVLLVILALAVAGWAAFQMTQLLRERDSLDAARIIQERPMENSQKLRDQLDGIARETQLLTKKGNAGVKLIVDELKKRGMTISTETPPAADKK